MKKMIIYNIKRLLPFALAASLISVTIGLFSVLFTPISYFPSENPNYNLYLNNFQSLIMELVIPMAVFAILMPLLLFGYRFNRRKSDLFLSAPFSDSVYRRTVLTIGCALIVIGFTISYWSCVGIYGLRFAFFVPERSFYSGTGSQLMTADFSCYIPVYFLAVLGIVSDYFIAAFLMGLGQDIVTAIFTYVISLLGVLLFFTAISGFFYDSFDPQMEIGFFHTLEASMRFDFVSWTSFVWSWFAPLFKGEAALPLMDIEGAGSNYLAFFFHYGAGIACGLLCYLIKERSGEWAGATPMRNYYVRIPFYGLAAAGGIAMSTLYLSNYMFWLSLALSLTLAYLAIALYSRSFKLKLPDLLPFMIFGGTLIAFFIVNKIGESMLPVPEPVAYGPLPYELGLMF